MATTMRLTARGQESRREAGLRVLLCRLEADAARLAPERMRERLLALDELEAAVFDLESADGVRRVDPELVKRAFLLRERLEAANAGLYGSLRLAIAGGEPRVLLPWLVETAGECAPEGILPGLGVDWRDDLVSGVLELREPGWREGGLSAEMVAYQPTPARHVVEMIGATGLAEGDVHVDLGSGLGHVPILAAMLSGAETVGIEVQAAYVESARECARRLRLGRVQFLAQDVREADLSCGTVFYLYTPFKGSILTEVLGALRRESERRVIRICSFGPCTRVIAKEGWLEPRTAPDTERVTVFDPR
jgi:hypothetical protein